MDLPQPMDDQPKPPDGSDDPERRSPLRRSVSGASERIEAIIEAAERAAAGIIEDAEAQASRYLDESRERADRITGERARVMSELTDSLVVRAEEVKRQSDDLIAALDRAKGELEARIAEDLSPPTAREEEPARALREVPPEPLRQVPYLKPVEPDPEGAATESPPPGAGARLLATQMAVAGSSRAEIESRLRSEFGIGDAGPMLDTILGPEA